MHFRQIQAFEAPAVAVGSGLNESPQNVERCSLRLNCKASESKLCRG
jgi:hypothetical protein